MKLVSLFLLVGLFANASTDPHTEALVPRGVEFKHPGRRAIMVAGLLGIAIVLVGMMALGLPPVILGTVIATGTAGADAMRTRDMSMGLQAVGRDNSLLTDEEWRIVSDELTEVVREQAVFNEVLQRFGITREQNTPGKTAAQFWTIQDRDGGRTMLLHGLPAGDMPMLSPTNLPIATHYADVHVPFEVLAASREGNLEARDALGIREAGAIVADLSNKFLAKGDSGLGIDGMLNMTSRQTSAGTDWTTAGNAYKDVLAMIKDLQVKNISEGAPKVLFIPPAQKEEAGFVFSSTGRPQIEAIAELIGGAQNVVVTNRLSAGTVNLIAMSRAYVQHLVTAPFQVTELGKLGMGVVFRVWKKETLFGGVQNAFVERTSV